MSDSKDPKAVLREQIEYWEERKAEAESQLRVANTVLPGLHDSLRKLEGDVGDTSFAPPANESQQAQAHPAEDSEPAVGWTHLRGAEEVSPIVETIVPKLPIRFTQAEVDAELSERGYEVNRSTLRTALQLMAGIGARIVVDEQGRGRRATVFRRVGTA